VRPKSLLAVAVSAVVGVAGGVGAGLLIDRAGFVDPLQLGVSLANQSCTGDTVLILGWGSKTRLATGVAEDPDHAHYLDTARSCNISWAPNSRDNPRYVAYVGPFDTTVKACQLRMTVQFRGDRVTSLDASNTAPAQCVCYLPSVGMPLLRIGMDPTAGKSIWIRSLQGMLADLDLLPVSGKTGIYDLATEAAVKQLQADRVLPTNGVVDPATWSGLKNKACGLYDS
jgi:hypothetical protein